MRSCSLARAVAGAGVLIVLGMWVSKLLLVVHLALASAAGLQVDTDHGTLTLEGLQKRGTEATIAGTFRTNGEGIQFRSTPYSVEIKTLDGKVLVKASSFSVAAQIDDYEDEEETAIYQILDDIFVEANNHLYRSTDAVHPAVHDDFARFELLAELQTTTVLANPQTEMQASVERLVAHSAVKLLEPAAFALGEDLGISGEDEPAALPFYTIAMTLTGSVSSHAACP